MALTTISSEELAVQGRVAAALAGRGGKAKGWVFELCLLACLLVSLAILVILLATVISNGVPVYSDRGFDFLDGGLSSIADRAGIAQGIIGSFWIATTVVVVAVPLGVGAAIYLEEYASRNVLTRFIELCVRNLAGVPSVVYGLLGLGIFVETFNGFTNGDGVERRTLLAAGLALAVLVLPIMIITTAEALRAVPQTLREGAVGVGATRWEVIKSVILPYAAPGIFTGALLSIARAVGEAAPLIVILGAPSLLGRSPGLSVGSVLDTDSLFEQGTALPLIVSVWAKQPKPEFNSANTAATILAMLVFVLLINSVAVVLRNRFEKKRL